MKRLAIAVCGLSLCLGAEVVCHVPHRPSNTTIAKWEEWGKAHPNWKPTPIKFDYACPPLDSIPEELTALFPEDPIDIPAESIGIDTLIPETPEPQLEIAQNVLPPISGGYPTLPIAAPTAAATPEPPTIYLIFLGMVIAEISIMKEAK